MFETIESLRNKLKNIQNIINKHTKINAALHISNTILMEGSAGYSGSYSEEFEKLSKIALDNVSKEIKKIIYDEMARIVSDALKEE